MGGGVFYCYIAEIVLSLPKIVKIVKLSINNSRLTATLFVALFCVCEAWASTAPTGDSMAKTLSMEEYKEQHDSLKNEILAEVIRDYPNYVTVLATGSEEQTLTKADTIFVPFVYVVDTWYFITTSYSESVSHTVSRLDKDPMMEIDHVWIGGAASPEGPIARNYILGENRAMMLAD